VKCLNLIFLNLVSTVSNVGLSLILNRGPMTRVSVFTLTFENRASCVRLLWETYRCAFYTSVEHTPSSIASR